MFLYHGIEDPVVPLELAKYTYKQFKDHNFKFTFDEERELEHSLSYKEI